MYLYTDTDTLIATVLCAYYKYDVDVAIVTLTPCVICDVTFSFFACLCMCIEEKCTKHEQKKNSDGMELRPKISCC